MTASERRASRLPKRLPPAPIKYVVPDALETKPVAEPDDLAIECLRQRERNWDSYDAEPVAESETAHALAIVQTAREAALKLGQSWLGPETDPTPRGHVSLTWRRDDQRFSLDIGGDGIRAIRRQAGGVPEITVLDESKAVEAITALLA